MQAETLDEGPAMRRSGQFQAGGGYKCKGPEVERRVMCSRNKYCAARVWRGRRRELDTWGRYLGLRPRATGTGRV